MKISEARECVFKVIFQMDFHENFDEIYVSLMNEQPFKGSKKEYALKTIEGIIANKDQLDSIIKDHLKDWTFERLSKTVVALLRLGVYEMLYNDAIPMVPAINEIVQLSHSYCEEKECQFINGLLHRVYVKERDAQ